MVPQGAGGVTSRQRVARPLEGGAYVRQATTLDEAVRPRPAHTIDREAPNSTPVYRCGADRMRLGSVHQRVAGVSVPTELGRVDRGEVGRSLRLGLGSRPTRRRVRKERDQPGWIPGSSGRPRKMWFWWTQTGIVSCRGGSVRCPWKPRDARARGRRGWRA